jgi:hypothetical protein
MPRTPTQQPGRRVSSLSVRLSRPLAKPSCASPAAADSLGYRPPGMFMEVQRLGILLPSHLAPNLTIPIWPITRSALTAGPKLVRIGRREAHVGSAIEQQRSNIGPDDINVQDSSHRNLMVAAVESTEDDAFDVRQDVRENRTS